MVVGGANGQIQRVDSGSANETTEFEFELGDPAPDVLYVRVTREE